MLYRKFKKLMMTPGLFFRDYFIKKYPLVLNEITCPQEDERILIKHDIALEEKIKVNFPIDVVFTWVDDKDKNWLEKLHFFRQQNSFANNPFLHDLARFKNHNEIYYSVQSVIKFLPWVRNIFLVTDGQKPAWADSFPQIKMVDHSEIIPEVYLPTFNSHVIEAHLHLIPGLAEHFIYFNDDVFVARELPASHFFKSNGLASLFLSDKSLVKMAQRRIDTPTLSASLKSKSLLYNNFKIEIDNSLVHTYVPLRKSMFIYAWDIYLPMINEFIKEKFRSPTDLNMATFLVPWLTYINGLAMPARDICYYFNIRSPVAAYNYKILLKALRGNTSPHSFCANDFSFNTISVNNYEQLLIELLEIYFGNGTTRNV